MVFVGDWHLRPWHVPSHRDRVVLVSSSDSKKMWDEERKLRQEMGMVKVYDV